MLINLSNTGFNAKTDVYIGRASPRKSLEHSIWANPFRIGRDGDREEVIEKYRNWIVDQPGLLAQLSDLKGKRLACWCYPDACHGQVLVELMKELSDEK